MVSVYFCNMPLLRFYHAVAVSGTLIFAYWLSASMISPIPGPVLVNNMFFFLAMTLWSLWINYWHQLYARQDYLHTRKLKDEAAKNSALFHEAAAANRAKSEFLAIMSHELRTPLNAILGFSDMMRSEVHGPIEAEEYKEYLEHVHDSGIHLLELINNILDLSKADAGKLELLEDEVDVNGVLRAVFDMVAPLAEADEVSLEFDVPPELPHMIADPRMVRQVMTNLLSNAIKFTKAGGSVRLSAGYVEGGDLTIKVADTGIGIAPENIPRILEPFIQVDSALNRRYEGTGLGLPLANKLMEVHGGSLAVESEVDKGTTVTITFPASRICSQGRAKAVSAGE